jgi:hypothetical protein
VLLCEKNFCSDWSNFRKLGKNLNRSWIVRLESYVLFVFIQWPLLYGITDNVINWLMGSNLVQLTSPKLHFHTKWRFKVIHSLLLVGCCNHIGRAQSDPTKQCLLYIFKWISVGVIQFEFLLSYLKGNTNLFLVAFPENHIFCVYILYKIYRIILRHL